MPLSPLKRPQPPVCGVGRALSGAHSVMRTRLAMGKAWVPRLEHLGKFTGYRDGGAAQLLRDGVPVVGRLALSGNGTPHEFKHELETQELAETVAVRNRRLLESLRQDAHGPWLLEQMEADAAKGRMTQPRPVTAADVGSTLMARRFSREQGLNADGSVKLRAVDGETGNRVN